LRSGFFVIGNNFFSNLVGIGFNKYVVGLDVVISLFSFFCFIVVKYCSLFLGAIDKIKVLDVVEFIFVIVFLMLFILLVKKFIKLLLFNCEGIFRSGGVWLFVNLVIVLNKNFGLFWLFFMSLWICSVLVVFRVCL